MIDESERNIPGDLHVGAWTLYTYLCCSADVDASGGIHVIRRAAGIFEIRYASLDVSSLREMWSSRVLGHRVEPGGQVGARGVSAMTNALKLCLQ